MSYDLDLDLENICRVCLQSNDKLVNLFTTQIVDGYMETMPEILNCCIGIAVNEMDILPKKICESCKTTIIGYYSFKKKCKRTEKVLQEVISRTLKSVKMENKECLNNPNIIEKSPEIISANEENIFTITQTDDSIKIEETIFEEDHSNSSASYNFENSNDINVTTESLEFLVEDIELPEHEDKSMSNDIEDPTIPETLEETIDELVDDDIDDNENDDDIKSTEENKDELTEIDKYNDKWFSADEEFFCEYCEMVITNETFIVHNKSNHYLCMTCYEPFDTNSRLLEHAESHRAPAKEEKQGSKLFCSICNKKWYSRIQFSQHMKIHKSLSIMSDNLEYYICDECHVMYLKQEDLSEHCIKSHESLNIDENGYRDYQFLEGEKPSSNKMVCGICNASYSSMSDLKFHMVLHLETFDCPFENCGCEYDTFSRLGLHIQKKHVYGLDHFCTYCQKKRFATFDELQLHIRNECCAKKFACNHCDKKFFSRKALLLHMKHSNGKKYMCQYCGKSFTQQGELKIHSRTHTGERPFKCTVCGKTYKTASMRAAHMDVHIVGKTFSCTICDKKLQTRTNHRNHMKRHTTEKKYACEICGKKFFTKYHLNLHTLKIHNKAKPI